MSTTTKSTTTITTTTTTKMKTASPKKILIQKYQEDLEALMIRNYSTRLFLTWIYKTPVPPLLLPLPTINIRQSKTAPCFGSQACEAASQPASASWANKVLSTSTTPLADIEHYITRLVDMAGSVVHFFFIQHCKRALPKPELGTGTGASGASNYDPQSVSATNSKDYNSLFVGCIYYADLFVRKNVSNSVSILDIIITSIVITIKMWVEEKMNVNKYISKIFSVSLSHINQLEIHFLKLIDYQLYLHEKDLKQFTDIIHKSSLQLAAATATASRPTSPSSQLQTPSTSSSSSSTSSPAATTSIIIHTSISPRSTPDTSSSISSSDYNTPSSSSFPVETAGPSSTNSSCSTTPIITISSNSNTSTVHQYQQQPEQVGNKRKLDSIQTDQHPLEQQYQQHTKHQLYERSSGGQRLQHHSQSSVKHHRHHRNHQHHIQSSSPDNNNNNVDFNNDIELIKEIVSF
ncbi:hypothetical protein SAMD00019534_061270 [Acytostelium subglobosum LB1]|uniref:hypothetical protein n=1 Tax=Acytostelium subglobosum LB1 TaxID=1410327 RepID=UPI000644A037|nr:hypothetical protein SAMD00019534_061270 [Acytostelium subglobosum LB1]GAM22952.1 hypothetical protein SAMD00019534_061270 [Acytostelium subglobosum LB1]|eukprot:XP_012754179.1 hypothetical protein SAMD00019534_061270 [Acytostelium subglobosum LB1]